MCSQYWTLNAKIKCPKCQKRNTWDLQTHFMGEMGSFLNEYNLNENVKELQGVSIVLNGKVDDFIGECPKCKKYFDVGANIVNGSVEKVFLL